MTPQPTNPDEPKSEGQDLYRLANIMMRALFERHDVLAKGWHEPVFGKKIHVGDDCPHCGTHFAGLREDIKRLFKYYAEQYARSAPQPANPLPSEKCKNGCGPYAKVSGIDGYVCVHCGQIGNEWPAVPLPTTPIESNPVNAWMLANGWAWASHASGEFYEGYWFKDAFRLSRDLAAEMYRMSEVRVKEAEFRGGVAALRLALAVNKYADRELYLSSLATEDLANDLEARNNKRKAITAFKRKLAQLAATNPRKEIEG